MTEFLLITGLSGAGRSNAANTFEDLGWFVIDNLPPALIGKVAELDGRVKGTEGLWVADASIMPEPPSGFVHFPTVMLAERLAEVIGPPGD